MTEDEIRADARAEVIQELRGQASALVADAHDAWLLAADYFESYGDQPDAADRAEKIARVRAAVARRLTPADVGRLCAPRPGDVVEVIGWHMVVIYASDEHVDYWRWGGVGGPAPELVGQTPAEWRELVAPGGRARGRLLAPTEPIVAWLADRFGVK